MVTIWIDSACMVVHQDSHHLMMIGLVQEHPSQTQAGVQIRTGPDLTRVRQSGLNPLNQQPAGLIVILARQPDTVFVKHVKIFILLDHRNGAAVFALHTDDPRIDISVFPE